MATRQKFNQTTAERRRRTFSEEFKQKKVREIEQKIIKIVFLINNLKTNDKTKIMEHNNQNAEETVTKLIENQISKLPSGMLLWASFAAMGASFAMKCMKNNNAALFLGLGAAPLLFMGIYNKFVKTEEHDEHHETTGLERFQKVLTK